MPDEAGFYFHVFFTDLSNWVGLNIDRVGGDELTLRKNVGGSVSALIVYASWGGAAGDIKVTRDGSGNWEIFDETGTSRGTTTDTYVPTSWDSIYLEGVAGTCAIDNLKVY